MLKVTALVKECLSVIVRQNVDQTDANAEKIIFFVILGAKKAQPVAINVNFCNYQISKFISRLNFN